MYVKENFMNFYMLKDLKDLLLQKLDQTFQEYYMN